LPPDPAPGGKSCNLGERPAARRATSVTPRSGKSCDLGEPPAARRTTSGEPPTARRTRVSR
jgi:hypothetical protein